MKIMIRCNHCGRDHRHDYCTVSGKIPSDDCLESDINPSDFEEDSDGLHRPGFRSRQEE